MPKPNPLLLASALLLVLGSVTTTVNAAAEWVEVPDQQTTLTISAQASGLTGQNVLTLDECVSTFEIGTGDALNQYSAISASSPNSAIAFFSDAACTTFAFSVLSKVDLTNVGTPFQSAKYNGQFTGGVPGIYTNVMLDVDDYPDSANDVPSASPSDSVPTPSATDSVSGSPTPSVSASDSVSPSPSASASSSDSATPSASASSSESATASPTASNNAETTPEKKSMSSIAIIGTAIGISAVLVGVTAGVLFWRRTKSKTGRRRGAGVFKSLDAERSEYGESFQGPNSSALMTSRVGVSFDDDRYPDLAMAEANGGYGRTSEDDGQLELSPYPQNPPSPTQYRYDEGTYPQNIRD